MVAYSFKARFREPILAGTKQQTIRAPRKRHARPGEEMQLFTGMRTKHCHLIAKVICKDVSMIRILVRKSEIEIMPSGETFRTAPELDTFARLDGFADWSEMLAFWIESHPAVPTFYGTMLRWHPIKLTAAEII
jgi:uncharacterized protein YqfB (UPF0267 family)